MNKEFSAGIIVYRLINNRPIYLLLQYAAGHWDFPKGHIEPGESKIDAANRELYEEAGIRAAIHTEFTYTLDYWFQSPDHVKKHKMVYLFLGKAEGSHITLSHEHISYAWLSYDDALAQLTYTNARDALKACHDFFKHSFS